MPYDIGYRRPPPASRFKKGASGNPKGRPKGSKNFLTLLEHELAQKVTVTENGQKKRVTRLQAMVMRLVTGALQGDHKGLLTLIEILRRHRGMEPVESDALVPDNYEEILDAYVKGRTANTTASTASAAAKAATRPEPESKEPHHE